MNTIAGLVIIVMSAVLFAAMGIDKKRAQNGGWRISEKALFSLALLGGAIGGCLGMRKFRHKTKHWYFKYGFPLIAIVQIAILLYYNII